MDSQRRNTLGLIFGSALGLLFFLACDNDGTSGDDGYEDVRTTTLVFTVNAEDYARNGFDSEDNWHLEFDHVYINIQGPTAFQVEVDLTDTETNAKRRTEKLVHAGHPHAEIPDGAANEALLGEYFVDGAVGEGPIELGRLEDVPIGNYNYLNFNIIPATEGSTGLVSEYVGYSMVMIGTAANHDDNNAVRFRIQFTEELPFTSCGPHPENLGVVAEGGTGTAEITIHLPVLFGDAEEGPADTEDEEAINYMAIGFGPFAALATDGVLDVTQADLQAMPEYSKMMEAVHTLGHYGEAHCNCVVAEH